MGQRPKIYRHKPEIWVLLVRAIKRFCLWHVDGAVRYNPAVQIIRKYGNSNSKILEVGSGSMGLSLYLPRPLVGLDVSHEGFSLGLLSPVKAVAGDLSFPFENRQFDFVISMDMLEHIPADERPGILLEMIRVSKKWVVITVPCGSIAKEYDAELYSWCKRRIGVDYRWLREHLELGLPQENELVSLINNYINKNREWELTIINGINVSAWLKIWKFTMSKSRVWKSLKNKLLWPFLPFILRQNKLPVYRKAFILKRVK